LTCDFQHLNQPKFRLKEDKKKGEYKIDGWNHHKENEKEGQRKAKRQTTCRNQKMGKS
jgi:hypothetical protein